MPATMHIIYGHLAAMRLSYAGPDKIKPKEAMVCVCVREREREREKFIDNQIALPRMVTF